MTDFRKLCAELVDEAAYLGSLPYDQDPDEDLMTRARAALSEPDGPAAPASVVELPSDEDLEVIMNSIPWKGSPNRWGRQVIRAALARWGGSQDAARYRWIKSAPGLRIERLSDHHFWISAETGERYSVTHTLAAFGTGFSGLPGLDDLVDQAMQMYPISSDND